MQTLFLLSPEIVLFLFAFVILSLDMAWHRDERKQSLLSLFAAVACIVTIVLAVLVWLLGDLRVIATDAEGRVPMVAADQFSLFFKIYAAIVVLMVGFISEDYIKKHIRFRGEFYALMLMAGLSLMFVASATNLLMIYLSFEFLSIISYVLTGYMREDERSIEGAVKYLIYGAAASGVMLYGFSLLYGATGVLDLHGIANGLATSPASGSALIVTSIILIVVGLGFKIALVPFHQWAPEAYQGAPTPITAFLSVGPKAAGFALMARIFFIVFPASLSNWAFILTGIAILTMTVGNLVAMWQKDIKRLFAYSSIAQAGYILMGIIAITPVYFGDLVANTWDEGINGMLIYLLAYLVTNIGAFAIIIALENETGSTDMSVYAGLFKRSPFLAVAFLIFMLSLVGIPPTAGFIGKFFVLGATLKQGMYFLATVAIINSVISLWYYFAIVRQMFFAEPETEEPVKISPPVNFSVAISVAAVLLIAIVAQPFVNWTTSSAQILASTF
ncbi:MAG: NADH-quinone oxidoreductase subunit N [Chloroflexota bacterium]